MYFFYSSLNGLIRISYLSLTLMIMATSHAQADICQYHNTEQEIHLSNVATDDACELLVADPRGASKGNHAAIDAKLAKNTHLRFMEQVLSAANQHALDPRLIHAVIAAESNQNQYAISPHGAQGLMQLMPATSHRFKLLNPYDPEQNINAGANYLRELLDLFKGDISLTLAAYNAGPNAVLRYGNRIPPYAETRRYVPRVLRIYENLSKNPS